MLDKLSINTIGGGNIGKSYFLCSDFALLNLTPHCQKQYIYVTLSHLFTGALILGFSGEGSQFQNLRKG